MAETNHLKDDWLNDAVKGFVVQHSQKMLLNLSHLKVYIPEPDHLLAMKTLAARVDATDKQDIQFLIRLMGIQTPEEVFPCLSNTILINK